MLFRDLNGAISIRDFITSCNDVSDITAASIDNILHADLKKVIYECDSNIHISDAECKSLIFIAGYVGFKLLQNKVLCKLSRNELVTEKKFEIDVKSNEF
jgi:hypothetical protein